MEEQRDIIVADRLGMVRTDSEEEYLAHLICLGARAVICSTGKSSSCTPETSPSSASGNDREDRGGR